MRLRNPMQGKCALCLNPKETEVAWAESETGGFKPLLVCRDHAFILAKNEPPVSGSPASPDGPYPTQNDNGEKQ